MKLTFSLFCLPQLLLCTIGLFLGEQVIDDEELEAPKTKAAPVVVLKANGIDLTVKGDGVKQVTVVSSFPFTVEAPKGGILYQWQHPPDVIAIKRAHVLEIKAAPKGELTIAVEWAVVDFKAQTVETKTGQVTVSIGGVQPKPDPKPDPDVDPKPSPISEPGLRVLIVYETAEANKNPELSNIISGAKVRSYMADKGAKDDGNVAFRAYDKDVNPSADYTWVKEAWKLERKSLPWIYVGAHPKGGTSEKLPGTVAETLALIRKYGD